MMLRKILLIDNTIFWTVNNETDNVNIMIVIITHAPTGSSLVSALRDILPGEITKNIFTIDVNIHDQKDEKILEAQQLINQYATDEVLIFTDIIGSTPYHIARQVLANVTQHSCVVVSGVSLPMLIKAANYRSLSLKAWVDQLMSCALDWVQAEFSPHTH